MWFFFLLVIIVMLAINYIIAQQFANIAEMKGYAGNAYFWFTFVFGLAGMLMVIALPAQTESKDITVVVASPEQSSTRETIPAATGNSEARMENDSKKAKYTKKTIPAVAGNSEYRIENDNKKVPYRCGQCGQAGPYDGNCPGCGSSIKRYNN